MVTTNGSNVELSGLKAETDKSLVSRLSPITIQNARRFSMRGP